MQEAATGRIRVAVADANDGRRGDLLALIDEDPTLVAVGEVRSGDALLELVDREAPDVALIASAMPVMDGLTTLRVLAPRGDVAAVMLTEEIDVEAMLDAVSLGAAGYLSLSDRDRWIDDGLGAYLSALTGTEGGESVSRIAGAPDGQVGTLVTVPAGSIAGLAAVLRAGELPLKQAVYVIVDGPEWLIRPLARRLHRSTPWRVLAAREGDLLAPGHAMMATLDAALQPVADGRRHRFLQRARLAGLADAVMAISAVRIATPRRPLVERTRRAA